MIPGPVEHGYGDRPKTFDCASRCALYEGGARNEGFEDCAQVFSELAAKNREQVDNRPKAAG